MHSVQTEPVDDLGGQLIVDQLTRLAGRLGQLAGQLGLSPAAERALRHDAAIEVNHRKWLALADGKYDEEVIPPAAPASSAQPRPANGTPASSA